MEEAWRLPEQRLSQGQNGHNECLYGRMVFRAGNWALSLILLTASPLFGAALEEARVTRIVNDVRLVEPAKADRTARLNDIIRGQTGLRTGIKSRSELLFQDETMARIGPDSSFYFREGTRDLTLKSGSLLLQVPKDHGGATIHTASVTASITGTTIMMEYQPNRMLKVLVLEGSLRLTTPGMLGDTLTLRPGKMVIMPPNAKRIPDPVTVDLKKVVQTSKLVNLQGGRKSAKAMPKLLSAGLIAKEVSQQVEQKHEKRLAETNLVIPGSGSSLLLATDRYLQTLQTESDLPGKLEDIVTSGGPTPTPTPAPLLADVGPAPKISLHDDSGSTRTEVRYGEGDKRNAAFVINNPQDYSTNHGVGDVKFESNDSVTISSTIQLSTPNSKRHDGKLEINSHKASGTAISVTSSGQILALLAAGPNNGQAITFKSAGGDIDVDGKVQADRGTIEMRNDGSSGMINLTNAVLAANVIKIGALGSNGTLNVGGGTISADSVIKLYAGGSNGTVNFIDDVTLSGNSVKTISGETVTIFNGKVVTINGPAPVDVFTNHANYSGFGGNNSTTGTFAGQGAVTHAGHGPGF